MTEARNRTGQVPRGNRDHSHDRDQANSHDHDHDPDQAHGHDHDHSHDFDVSGPPEAHREPLPPGSGQGKLLYFDAQSGAAGDMTIASLVDLGVPFAVVEQAIEPLGLSVELSVRKAFAGAIGATKFDVRPGPDQSERSYAQIRQLIDRSSLAESTKRLAQRIFLRLAEAESAVHRMSLDSVQFHEVGAVDAICDIVGAAACIDYLGAEVVCSPLPLGSGYVHCRHGRIPIPAPATVLCLRGLKTYDSGLEAELVTPTGAAILASVSARCERWPQSIPIRVGWGRGTRDLPDRPNALRAIWADRDDGA